MFADQCWTWSSWKASRCGSAGWRSRGHGRMCGASRGGGSRRVVEQLGAAASGRPSKTRCSPERKWVILAERRKRLKNVALIVEAEPRPDQLARGRVARKHAAGALRGAAADHAQRLRAVRHARPHHDLPGAARAAGTDSGAPGEVGRGHRVARGGALLWHERGAGAGGGAPAGIALTAEALRGGGSAEERQQRTEGSAGWPNSGAGGAQ